MTQLCKSLIFLAFIFLSPFIPDSLSARESDERLNPASIDSINKEAFKLVFSDQEKVMQLMYKYYPKAWEIKDTSGYLNSLNILGIAHDIKGNLDSSEFYFSKTLELSKLYKNEAIEEKSTNNLGMMNWNKGNLFTAQQYFFSALKISESQNNEKRMSVALSNIGLIYQELYMDEKALSFHRKALSIRLNDPDLKSSVPLSLNNLAISLQHIDKIDSAIILANQGLELAREINDKLTEGNLLTTLGNCFYDLKNYNLSLTYCLESARIKEESGNYLNLNKTYNSICDIYLATNQPAKALEYALKSKKQLEISGVDHDWEVYMHLAKSYFHLGNRELGESFFKRSNEIKDSIFSRNHAHSFAELEIMHQTHQQSEALNKFKFELTEEKLKVQKQNFLLILLGTGLLVFMILAVDYVKKQRFKKEQLRKELDLREKLAISEVQNQLNTERMRISKDLHDNIGSQLTLVTSSIDNLCYKLPENSIRNNLLQISSFTKDTMRQLRDSIWALNQSEFSSEEFHLRVLDFINRAKISCPGIKFESKMTGSKDAMLTPEQGINLLYIVQEIVNNAIKYSGGKNIRYFLHASANQLKVEIADNGKGFRKETVAWGNGLKNIDTRIERINGRYSIEASEGNGVKYLITLNI